MRLIAGSLVSLLFLTGPAWGGSISTRIVWLEGKPHAEVTLTGDLGGAREIDVPAELFDAQGARLWNGPIKVKMDGARPWKARIAVPNIKEPKKQHRLVVSLQHEALGGDYREEINFGQETSAVQTHGILAVGVFPDRKVLLTLGLNGIRGTEKRDIPVALRVRDGEDNVVLTREAKVTPAAEPALHLIDVTPDPTAVGPFALEANIESEAHQLFFSASLRFAQPNALVPVSSFEHGDPAMWFLSSPQNRPSYQTGQYYYSPHLTDQQKTHHAGLSYDRDQKHSGRQSLRLDYKVGGETDVWGTQPLPGKPLALALWVKGNESKDELIVHFEDSSNLTLPAWERRGNFSSASVGKLDFAGWKRFRVPVLGDGLQVSSVKGSTDKVDAPVRILAFTVRSAADPKAKDARRSVWIDDLAAETQVPPAEMLSLEVQNDDAEGRLLPGGQLGISVGNGYRETLKRGRVTLSARDGSQKAVWTHAEDCETAGQGFTSVGVPLRELAEKKPRGPVDVDVTFQDVSRPGTRITRRITLKAAAQACVVHDFEEPATFSGYQPGKVGKSSARIVPGGADGKGHALALEVKPKLEDNSVLLHPALPGVVERVEFMVKGGDRPVTLQPWLIDSGYTGVWLRPYNLFWGEPITVDWQGWRKVSVAAPPVPAHFGDKNRYFYRRPWYPLHLALNGKTEADTPVEVRIDDVRVVTHLPDDEQLRAEIDYPDETRIHPPGSPLQLIVSNFAPEPATLSLRFALRSYQGFTAREGKLEVSVPSGARQRVVLLPSLPAGIHDLVVEGLGKPVSGPILVLDAKRYFGEEPLDLLVDPLRLRRQLGLTSEKVYLDWDNFEAAPHLQHYHWFEEEVKKVRAVPLLPKELTPLAAKNDEAAEALKKAEQAMNSARQQFPQMLNAEKQAEQKVDATQKQIPPAKMEEEKLAAQAEMATTKAATAMKEAEKAAMVQADAMKAVQAAEAALKPAQANVVTADKALQKAMTEKDPAVRKAETEKARAVLDAARMKQKEAETRLQAAKQAQQQAMQKATATKQNADNAKREQGAADQRLQAARKRVSDLEKMLEADRKALADRKKTTQDAREGIEKAERALDDARTASEKAEKTFEDAKTPHGLKPVPVVGFCAEWAGPEAADALTKGAYVRWIPNRLQLPRRLVDWDLFLRATQREYRGRFDSWVFWENPDLVDSPQSIPPAKYRPMLESFARWVKLYSPGASVVAGGFNFPRAVDYLARVPDAHTLPFDEIAVQMNLGELSPEGADLEGFLDELNDLLKIQETKRIVRPTELDWSIGKHLTPLQQAAYHARATLILDSRGVPAHQLSLINTGFEFEGFGVFHRVSYGSSPEVQTFKPYHVPKPSYFALVESRRFLKDWKFVSAVTVPDRSLADNRCFLYRNEAGRLTVALWRAVDGERLYRIPPSWKGTRARDVFGFDVSLDRGLRVTALPTLVEMPEGTKLDVLQRELRTLEREDGKYTVVLDLHLGEEASTKQAGYQGRGSIRKIVRGGAILGERKVRETYLDGLETEQFEFDSPRAGNLLLVRRWHFGRGFFSPGTAGKVYVRLNGGPEQVWDLSRGQDNQPGLRETCFVLRGCKAGKNEVAIRHERPSSGAGWRVETMPDDHLPLERLGMLNGRQTKGEIVKHASAVGTPLMLEKKVYETGIGTHATSFIEYPLSGQFSAFEATVGIDAVTEGRGSVLCRVFVDGKERASSGVINGFSKPKVLKVDNLAGAQRLILSVTDAGDGNRDDLADWVEGRLLLKR